MTKILILFLLLTSCKKIEVLIDSYFENKRTQRICARVVIDFLDLQYRLEKESKNTRNFLLSAGETEQLKKLEVQSIFDDLKKNNDIKSMIELEEKVFQTLKSEPIISGCLDFVSSSSCEKKEPAIKIECIRLMVRLYQIESLLNSEIINFFPDDYLKRIKEEREILKTLNQN